MASVSIPLSGESNSSTPATDTQPSKADLILQSIQETAALASSVASRFGHASVGAAIAAGGSIAPVFVSFYELIENLVKHK